ncbi:MAG: hypothetical protein LBV78_13495 [Kitasatospora sp.]|jgi:hypothetical protein|nr:hypothetical protein [Kitasatospora sp.]
MAVFNYTAVQDPDPVEVKAELVSIEPKEIKAKITHIQHFTVVLESRDTGIPGWVGNVIGKFVSVFKEVPYDKVKKEFVDKEHTITLDKPIGYSFTVKNDTVALTAKTLELDTYQGMLIAGGTVEIG